MVEATAVVDTGGDHPREYGENTRGIRERYEHFGSSPRIRGKFSALVEHYKRIGIIPANTGKIR